MKNIYVPHIKAFAFFCLLTVFSIDLSAQVGIGTSNPNGGSILDVESTNKGVLIPRVNIANLNTLAPVTGGQAEGMLVYNTNTTTGPGFFYWNSNTTTGSWIAVSGSAATNNAWELEGNAGTTPGTGAGENYIGTSDTEDLLIATDGVERVRVLSSGEIGIGASPDNSAALDISATDKGVSFPNVNLTSESDATTIASPVPGLMVYNTNAAMPCGTGLYFNNGTAAVPVWSCFLKTTQQYHSYNTNSITLNSTNIGTFYLHPGLQINFTVPAGQTVDVKIDALLGVINNNTANNRTATFDTVIVVDGAFLPRGGYNRTTNANPGGGFGYDIFGMTNLSTVWQNVAAGNHTIELYSMYIEGNTAIILGGDCTTDVNCGELNAVVTYK